MSELRLAEPNAELLESYVDGLRSGEWVIPRPSADVLAEIEEDPEAFLKRLIDPNTGAPQLRGPDGEPLARMLGYHLWLSDGTFAGDFGVRWLAGTHELPDPWLGHVGYGVIESKRQRGYATAGLALTLEHVRANGPDLDFVELTTSESNVASQRVIEANGGALVERVEHSARHGGEGALRYRITLARPD